MQTADTGVTSALYGKRKAVERGNDARFQARYQEWQGYARLYARTISAAAFNAAVIADLCARCELRIERREGRQWAEVDDDSFAPLMERYANPLQGPDELVRHHAWHYQVAGEMVQVQRDGEQGVEYAIHSVSAVDWDTPEPGFCTVKLVPDGKVTKRTAYVVPRNQVKRFWVPDQEWQAYATSPMAAGIDDLKRYKALAKYALQTADSAVAMSGLLWAPGEAFVQEGTTDDDDAAPRGAGTPDSPLERLFYSIASMRHSDSEDVTAIAPALLHWEKELGPPHWVKMGEPLDPQGIAFRKEALQDFGRGTNLPVTTVEGGGVGDANHWSEWLATDKMFESAVAPTMDRVCHLDLTRSFLWPIALVAGFQQDQLRNLRVGYDPQPVLVKPDKSANALDAWKAGLLGSVPAIEACGWTNEDLPTPEDRAWLLTVLSHREQGSPPVQVDSGTVMEGPPERPSEVPDTPPPPAIAAAAPAVESGEPTQEPEVTEPAARRAFQRLTRLRQQLGTKLLAESKHAYQAALRQAGARFVTRARARSSSARQASVREAVQAEAPLRAFMAAVGLKESELLAHEFDVFRQRATEEFALYAARLADLSADLGVDLVIPTEEDTNGAVDYLVAALTASVRARLLDGREAVLAAAAPSMIPLARRRPPTGGDILPGLPDPDELAQAAARFTRDAMRINEGTMGYVLPPTSDQTPLVMALTVPRPTLTSQIAEHMGARPQFTWMHAFYGEPATVFEPHEALDGFATSDPSNADTPGDPDLANSEAWPEADAFYPGDHDGCTCEWVPA